MDEDKVLAVLDRLEVGQRDLAQLTATKLDHINQRVEHIDQRLGQVDQRLERVNQRLERVDQRLEQVDQRLEQVDQRFEQVDQRFEQVDQRVGRLDERLDQFRVVVMNRFEKMEDRLTGMLDDITVNMGAAAHVGRRQDNDREEMRTLHNLVMTLETKLRRIQTNVEELQKKAS